MEVRESYEDKPKIDIRENGIGFYYDKLAKVIPIDVAQMSINVLDAQQIIDKPTPHA